MADKSAAIIAVGHRGEGIAEVDGRKIFVPYSLPGDRVRLKEIDGQEAASVTEQSSPHRATPFCPHFGICGGCQAQHMDPIFYREWKRQLLVRALADQELEPHVETLVDAHGQGRRRIVLHSRRQDGEQKTGFMLARSHDVASLDTCPILVPELIRSLTIAGEIGTTLGNCDVAFTASLTGLDVHVKAEAMPGEHRHGQIIRQVEKFDLARLSVNADIILANRSPVVRMGRAEVVLPVQSFLQATDEGERALAEAVLEGSHKSKHVADLFCGCGPFALRLAEGAKVYAIDSDRAAVQSLLEAARKASGLKPVQTSVRNLFREPLTPQELNAYDAVVMDPPRAGAEAQCRQLTKSKVRRVVAVSCNPTTFARDARVLVDGGYALKKVTPIDQFKWSSHLEMVGVFSRN